MHVQRERQLAKFWLEPILLAGSTGFTAHEIRELVKLVTDNREEFLEAWHEYFGR